MFQYRGQRLIFLHVMATCVGVLAHGCVQRSFNKSYRDPKSAPLVDEKSFSNALYDAARKALTVFSNTDLEAFFESFALDALRAGEQQKFVESIPYRSPLEWSLKRSWITPVWLSSVGQGSIPQGGIIVLQNNLYPEGYFRQRAASLPLKDLMSKAPWFEWNGASQTYTPRLGGAPERILKSLFELRGAGDDFELYRGADAQIEVPPASQRNPYDSGKSELKEVMYFSSPSLNTALSWARPAVWLSKVPRDELLQGVSGAQPSIYVGFEYNYPEIAFLRSKLVPVPAVLKHDRAKVLCIAKEKVQVPASGGTAQDLASSKTQTSHPFCDSSWLSAHTSGFPEPLTKIKSSKVRQDALLKSVAVPDDELPEGYIVCRLKAGTTVQYTDAFAMPKKQVWVHARQVPPEWNCPRGFASDKFYMDQEKISVDLTP